MRDADPLLTTIKVGLWIVQRDRRIERTRRLSMPTSSELFHQKQDQERRQAQQLERDMRAIIDHPTPPTTPQPPAPAQGTKPMGKPLIEIKGLGANVGDICKQIASVRSLATDVNLSGSKLAAELQDVHTQIEQARSDLRFQAESLGNSQASSGNVQSGETQQGEQPKTEPPPVV